jgi:hypothetical protein
MRYSTPRGISCAMAAVAIGRLSVAKPRCSECCVGAGKSVQHPSPHLLLRRGGVSHRQCGRGVRILHESTLPRYFARPASVASLHRRGTVEPAVEYSLTIRRDRSREEKRCQEPFREHGNQFSDDLMVTKVPDTFVAPLKLTGYCRASLINRNFSPVLRASLGRSLSRTYWSSLGVL